MVWNMTPIFTAALTPGGRITTSSISSPSPCAWGKALLIIVKGRRGLFDQVFRPDYLDAVSLVGAGRTFWVRPLSSDGKGRLPFLPQSGRCGLRHAAPISRSWLGS